MLGIQHRTPSIQHPYAGPGCPASNILSRYIAHSLIFFSTRTPSGSIAVTVNPLISSPT